MLKCEDSTLGISSHVLMSILKEEEKHREKLPLGRLGKAKKPVSTCLRHHGEEAVRHLLSSCQCLLFVVRMQELDSLCSRRRFAELVEALSSLQSKELVGLRVLSQKMLKCQQYLRVSNLSISQVVKAICEREQRILGHLRT